MNADDFDALVQRLRHGANRRKTLQGIVGGTLTSVGAASLADAKAGRSKKKGNNKKSKDGKQATDETNSDGHGKRIFCFCPNSDPQNCRTRRMKTKRFKKRMRKHKASYRGPCQDTTTTSPPSTSPPSTSPPTSNPPTSNPPSS